MELSIQLFLIISIALYLIIWLSYNSLFSKYYRKPGALMIFAVLLGAFGAGIKLISGQAKEAIKTIPSDKLDALPLKPEVFEAISVINDLTLVAVSTGLLASALILKIQRLHEEEKFVAIQLSERVEAEKLELIQMLEDLLTVIQDLPIAQLQERRDNIERKKEMMYLYEQDAQKAWRAFDRFERPNRKAGKRDSI